jgi:hypothetical protein
MAVKSEFIQSPRAQNLEKFKCGHGNISGQPLHGGHPVLGKYYAVL